MSKLNSQSLAQDQHRRQLLALTAVGSRDAFNQLYRIFYVPLARFVYRYTHSPELIEEIVNDTLLVVWQKANTFRGDSQVSSWVMGIAARKSYNALKQLKRSKWANFDQQDFSGDVNTIFDGVSKAEAVELALQHLSALHRAVVELAYIQGHTCNEIAEIIDCPVSTVKTRLHYARKQLRKLFQQGEENDNVIRLSGDDHD